MKIIGTTCCARSLDKILSNMRTSPKENIDILVVKFISEFLMLNESLLDKTFDSKHPLIVWGKAFLAKETDLRSKNIYGQIKPNGYDLSLLNFGFDLINLYAQECLPKEVLIKIFNRDGFYGARYEILIASIFLVCGYSIEWFESDNNQEKIPEFRAIKDNEVLLIEVKSRDYRREVSYTEPYLEKLKIQKYLQESISKNKGEYSFLIFYDLNLPYAHVDSNQQKILEANILKAINALKVDQEGRLLFDFAYISNWAWHYHVGDINISQQKIETKLTPIKSLNPVSSDSLNTLDDHLKIYGSNDFRDKIVNLLLKGRHGLTNSSSPQQPHQR